jgi:hypothetical protein
MSQAVNVNKHVTKWKKSFFSSEDFTLTSFGWWATWCDIALKMCFYNAVCLRMDSYAITTFSHIRLLPFFPTHVEECSGAVGWGTVLQAGRSRVRFPMVSLEFFIDIILSGSLNLLEPLRPVQACNGIALPYLYLLPHTCKNVCQFSCTEQKAPDSSEVHRLLQNCGSSVWHLLHSALQARRIWRWLLYFWKISWPFLYTVYKVLYSNSKMHAKV